MTGIAWRLGVDYGSSHTVAVLSRPGGETPRPLTFDGSPLLSSAIYAEPDGTLLTGQDAHAAARSEPARHEPHPKRQIDAGTLLLGDRQVPVTEAIAATLRRVAEEAARVSGGADLDVVLTHPAGWGPTRRATLRAAAESAGFAAPAMLPEPVAAASQALSGRDKSGKPLLVYDLGGGTFDVALVRDTDEGVEILAADGTPDLGGQDLDALVVDLVRRAVEERDPPAWARLSTPATPADRRHFRLLWDNARLAKESLSRRSSATVAVPLLEQEAHLTREQFERSAAPVLALTVDQTLGLLRRAALSPADLDGILLVGGATRTPLVATLLHRAMGGPPTVLEQPELIVAEGAVHQMPSRPKAPATPQEPPPPTTPKASTPDATPASTPAFRTQGARGPKLTGAAVAAAALIGGIWYATAHASALNATPPGAQAFGIALLVGAFLVMIGDLARAGRPDLLLIDGRGIHMRRIRWGRGIQDLSLPWPEISEVLVAPPGLPLSLVVRTHLGPRDGAARTGRPYRSDVNGYELCTLREVGASPVQLRTAIAAHRPT
ncbi:Hsp70 family protein [Dactylosporangium darangshiense]|uniref:Hsp70 family protein n=1 Tax=Dactylosporangium darangshiense TaxID=579108 RepID=UPI0031ED039E